MTPDPRLDQIDDLIDEWHDGDDRDLPLPEYLAMTPGQYAAFAGRCELPVGYVPPAWPVDVKGLPRSTVRRADERQVDE
jgi:hypothetical protein